jgi:hypothetical protein
MRKPSTLWLDSMGSKQRREKTEGVQLLSKKFDLTWLIAGKAYHSLNWTNSAEDNLPSFGRKPKEKKPPSLLSLLL